MEVGNRVAFIIIWFGVITITGTLSFTAGEKKYQKLDHSSTTIGFYRSATQRFKSLYFEEKKINKFLLDSLKSKNEQLIKIIYETNNTH